MDVSILQGSLNQALVTNKLGTPNKWAALCIEFYNAANIPSALSVFSEILPTATPLSHALVALMPSLEEADFMRATLWQIISEYDNTIVNQPFDENWLNQYLLNHHGGVENIWINVSISSASDFLTYESTLTQSVIENNRRSRKENACKDQCVRVRESELADGWAQYACLSCAGFEAFDESRAIFGAVFSALCEFTIEQHFINTAIDNPLLSALFSKAYALITSDSNNKHGTENDLKKIVCAFRSLNNADSLNALLSSCSSLVESVLVASPHAHYLQQPSDSFFKPLGKNGQEKGRSLIINVPFGDNDLYTQLAWHNIIPSCNKHQSTLRTFSTIIASYFLRVMERRQSALFDSLLKRYSQEMNFRPLATELFTLFDASRPGLHPIN